MPICSEAVARRPSKTLYRRGGKFGDSNWIGRGGSVSDGSVCGREDIPEYSTPARITTRGFLRSEGLIVIQKPGIPYRTIILECSNASPAFVQRNRNMLCDRNKVLLETFNPRIFNLSPAASAFAAFSSWSTVSKEISLIVDLQC